MAVVLHEIKDSDFEYILKATTQAQIVRQVF